MNKTASRLERRLIQAFNAAGKNVPIDLARKATGKNYSKEFSSLNEAIETVDKTIAPVLGDLSTVSKTIRPFKYSQPHVSGEVRLLSTLIERDFGQLPKDDLNPLSTLLLRGRPTLYEKGFIPTKKTRYIPYKPITGTKNPIYKDRSLLDRILHGNSYFFSPYLTTAKAYTGGNRGRGYSVLSVVDTGGKSTSRLFRRRGITFTPNIHSNNEAYRREVNKMLADGKNIKPEIKNIVRHNTGLLPDDEVILYDDIIKKLPRKEYLMTSPISGVPLTFELKAALQRIENAFSNLRSLNRHSYSPVIAHLKSGWRRI